MARLRRAPTILVMALLLAAVVPTALAEVGWSRAARFGGDSQTVAWASAMDRMGNVYATGVLNGTADFDPGGGTFNLTSAGAQDVFVAKLAPDGDLLWAHAIGGASSDEGLGIFADPAGNVYVTGYFMGTVDFDPGPGTSNLTSAGDQDMFVLKLSTDGDLLWAKRIGGAGADTGSAIAVDRGGNVLTTGYYTGTVDFDPGAGEANLPGVGDTDAFVSKLDSGGAYVWARLLGGAGSEEGLAIATDAADNVYSAGRFAGTVDFDPSGAVSNRTSNGGTDGYAWRLDADGYLEWAAPLGGTGDDTARAISVDRYDFAVVGGSFAGMADLDPHLTNSLNLTSAGGLDAFLVRLDYNGELTWAKHAGGVNDDEVTGVHLGGVIESATATGTFSGTVDFDPGPETASATAANGGGFVWKLSALGDYEDHGIMSGTGTVRAEGLGWDGSGGFAASGRLIGTADFDPGPGVAELTASGPLDAYVTTIGKPTLLTHMGSNRYHTASLVGSWAFPRGPKTAFVAVGTNFPDALAGAAVAGLLDAPLFLVRSDSIPSETLTGITNMDPDSIVVLGGTNAVSQAVFDQLSAIQTNTVRVFGINRYATAVAISQLGFPATARTVVIATGLNFPDALAAAPAAVVYGGPVLLTDPNTIPQVVRDEITRLAPERIVVVGGTAVISDDVVNALKEIQPNTVRIAGANRYDTAIGLAQDAFPDGASRVTVATGLAFPDALAGAAAAGAWRGPILLVPGTSLPSSVSTEILRLDPFHVDVLGGDSAISPQVRYQIGALLFGW